MAGALPALDMKRHQVAKAGEIPVGGRKIVMAGRLEVGIFNVAGEIKAYRNACPHAGAPVCTGKISGTSQPSKVYEYIYGSEGFILRCPWHGWEFDLRTGRHLVDPENQLKEMPVEQVAGDGLDPLAMEESQGTLYVLLPD
jgi:nitrite reductase (NADH) small subunit